MPKTYRDADDAVGELAGEIIAAHHPNLDGCDIRYIFVTNEDKDGNMKYPKPNKHGHLTLGKAKGFSAADRVAGCPDFTITLLYNWWEQATEEQQTALVDHELCHCGREVDDETGEVEMGMVPHDFEGFNEELQRHGPWTRTLQVMESQLTLFAYEGPSSVVEALRGLCPEEGSGVTSVTISAPGITDNVAVLTSDTRKRIEQHLAEQ